MDDAAVLRARLEALRTELRQKEEYTRVLIRRRARAQAIVEWRAGMKEMYAEMIETEKRLKEKGVSENGLQRGRLPDAHRARDPA